MTNNLEGNSKLLMPLRQFFEDNNVSTRVTNAICSEMFHRYDAPLAHFLTHTEAEVKKMPRIGRKCIQELRDALQPHGLSMGVTKDYTEQMGMYQFPSQTIDQARAKVVSIFKISDPDAFLSPTDISKNGKNRSKLAAEFAARVPPEKRTDLDLAILDALTRDPPEQELNGP